MTVTEGWVFIACCVLTCIAAQWLPAVLSVLLVAALAGWGLGRQIRHALGGDR